MKKEKMTRREWEIEEASYREGWRMEVESWGPGVWYSDGSQMKSQIGPGAVNRLEPANPYVYALGSRTTVYDGEMKGIQMALKGAEAQEGTGREITVAADSQAAIRAVERVTNTSSATSEEGRTNVRSIRQLAGRGTRVGLVWVKAHRERRR